MCYENIQKLKYVLQFHAVELARRCLLNSYNSILYIYKALRVVKLLQYVYLSRYTYQDIGLIDNYL